jgi:hypothetical protein
MTNANLTLSEKGLLALKEAFSKLVRERRLTGESLILWKDGKVVHVPASDIPDSDLTPQ